MIDYSQVGYGQNLRIIRLKLLSLLSKPKQAFQDCLVRSTSRWHSDEYRLRKKRNKRSWSNFLNDLKSIGTIEKKQLCS